MNLLRVLISILCLLSFCLNASGQKFIFGLKGGLTQADDREVYTPRLSPRKEYINSSSTIQGSTGYQVGTFFDYKFGRRYMVRSELGYEQLRFRTGLSNDGQGKFHHLKGGVLLGVEPFPWWAIMGGMEIVRRTHEVFSFSTRFQQLNGSTVRGWYWQSVVATQFRVRLIREIQIGLSVNLSPIRSVFVSTDNCANCTAQTEYTAQLRAYQFTLGIPLWTR